MADEAKAKGNEAFSAGNYTKAIKNFTDAIKIAPTNHVLYSNRSGAYASLNQYSEALSDAQKTVELQPDWSKGYSRLGAAHHGLRQYKDAISAYKKGLEVDPNNETLKCRLVDAYSASASISRSSRPEPISLSGDTFGPDMWQKLNADPTTRIYMRKPDFVNVMKEIQRNPESLKVLLKDQRVMQAIRVLSNAKPRSAIEDKEMPGSSCSAPMNVKFDVFPDAFGPDMWAKVMAEVQPLKKKKREAGPEPETEPRLMEVNDEEDEINEKKDRAQKEKETGNYAYKKNDFETAIRHYSTAMELYDGDISFLTNRAAVYLEMGKYQECIMDCDKAVERGRELESDSKMVAIALTRKGTALVKLAKTSNDYELAIKTFQKALTEHQNSNTLKKLNDAERAKEELEQEEYYDPELADKEREKGNDCFKVQKYPDAIKHYTESIRRNAKDPRAYSNRAACYTKLGAMAEGLKDAHKCIELDPNFTKGYYRKGAIHFFMKEYDEALEAYQEGLKHDAHNQELLEGVRICGEHINRSSRGDLTADELKKRQFKAMQDPEILGILTDPAMAQVLKDLRENPKAVQDHMKNPLVMNKIQKLISSGIVKMK